MTNNQAKFGIGLVVALGLIGLGFLPNQAQAQQAVVTSPSKANTNEGSGTIVATDVFQSIWAAVTSGNARGGCLVLNNSTNRQWVYFQGPGMTTPTAGNVATIKAASIPLEPATVVNALGGTVSCADGAGGVLQDRVWIAGTISDTFVAKQQ